MRFSVAIAVLSFCTTFSFGEQVKTTASVSGILSVRLVEADGKPATKLKAAQYTTKSGDTLDGILINHWVVPNGDSISIFHDLNPGLAANPNLAPGTTLAVPTLSDPETPKMTLLQVDRLEKQAIFTTAATIQAKVVKSPNAIILQPASDQLLVAGDKITHTSASHLMLQQIRNETGLLETVSAKPSLTQSDQLKINEVTLDLWNKNKSMEQNAPDPLVQIKTSRSDGKDAQPYTICYAAEFMYDGNCSDTFPLPSTPTTEFNLPVAIYMIWAVSPTNNAPASEPKKVIVQSATVSVGLFVK